MNSAALPVIPPTVSVPVLSVAEVHLLDEIISDHAHELTIRRKQLTACLKGSVPDDSSWHKEVNFFVEQIVDPQAGSTKDSAARSKQVRQMIETATAHCASSRVCFTLEREPLPFEHLVADALADLGWNTCFVDGQGERGFDVISEMREKCVVIQCKHSRSTLDHTIVVEAYAGKAIDTDYVAIVSNAGFTWNARRQAAGARVILLYPHQLTQLEERIFGTDTWRSNTSRT
jgi:hypothetical protein